MKYRFKNFLLCLILLIPFSLILHSSYAVMIAFSTEELTREADLIIIGKAKEKVSMYTKDKKMIITQIDIEIKEVIKGSSGEIVKVEYVGGEVDGIGMGRSDAPHLEKDEEVLLFLKSIKSMYDDSKVFHIVGEAQGKYTISDGYVKKGDFAAVLPPKAKKYIDNHIPLKKIIKKIKLVKERYIERLEFVNEIEKEN